MFNTIGIYASSSCNIICSHRNFSTAAQWADSSSPWSYSGGPAISYSVSTSPDSSGMCIKSSASIFITVVYSHIFLLALVMKIGALCSSEFILLHNKGICWLHLYSHFYRNTYTQEQT